MKSKNPYAFWLRWFAVSGLHAIFFTGFWMSNGWVFAEFYGMMLFNFVSGIALAALQYWAMTPMMRPNARRWFSASVLAQGLAVSLHAIVVGQTFPNVNGLALWLSLFLMPALAQSWALSERFKRAWIFGLAFFFPMYFLFAQLPITELYQNYALFEIAVQMLRAIAMGASLVFLQRYQSKETSSLGASNSKSATAEETLSIPEEDIDAAQQEEGLAAKVIKQ